MLLNMKKWAGYIPNMGWLILNNSPTSVSSMNFDDDFWDKTIWKAASERLG